MTTTTESPAFVLAANEHIETAHDDTRVVIAEWPDDDEQGAVEIIVGRIKKDANGVYLACLTCGQEVARSDAGMCGFCRDDRAQGDLAFHASEDAFFGSDAQVAS